MPTRFDSGWSWIILLATSVVFFIWGGILKAFSVLLPTLKDQFETHTWIIGVMITLMHAVRDLSSVFVGALVSFADNRILVISGGIISGLALVCASFSTSVTELVVFVSIVCGAALSLVTIPSISILPQYFDKYFSLAVGVGYASCGVAFMVFAPLTQFFLDAYGWRNSVLLLGAILFHIVVCGSLLRPAVRKPENNIEHVYTPLEDNGNHNSQHMEGETSKFASCLGLSLLKNISFLAVTFMMASFAFTFSGWVVYFVPHCLAKGMSTYESVYLAIFSGFVHCIGYFAHVPFLSKNILSVRGALYLSGIVSAISLAVDKWMTTFRTILLSNSFYVYAVGSGFVLSDVHLRSVVDIDMFPKAFGLRMTIIGMIRPLAGFFVGWIYDQTGSYDGGFFILGAVQAAGVLVLAADHLRIKMAKMSMADFINPCLKKIPKP